MNTILPAIIPESLEHLRNSIGVLKGKAPAFQIDIVDGAFVPFRSWPYKGSGSIMLLRKYALQYEIEVDLMIEKPEEVIPEYLAAGVGRVVVHLESVADSKKLFREHKERGYMLGLSIRNDTPLETLLEAIPYAEYVQLMGIREIGSQGQPFDTEVLERIRAIRGEFLNLEISIDGSVNRETLPQLRDAGANRFIAGSAIMKADDPVGAYEALCAL